MPAIELLEDLFFIERGYLNANHFVYRAQQPILIDTGYLADFSTTKALITRLGVDLSGVQLIVNTHSHCDHIGGNRIIQELSGCDIAIHKVGKYFSDNRDDWSTWWRYFDQEADFFTCTIALDDGDSLAIGPYDFQVIYTPGHAADGLALYNPRHKILISSDALWGQDSPIFVLRVEGSRALFEALASLDRLDGLAVDIAYPGHGPPFTDIKAAIGRARQRLAGYIANRKKLGVDIFKRMVIYDLLMYQGVEESAFFERLVQTAWFKENVDFHFNHHNYEAIYNQTMTSLYQRGVIEQKDGKLFTTVKP